MIDARNEKARLALVRRAASMAVRSLTTVATYETLRVLKPHGRLEAETKMRLGRAILEGVGMHVEVIGTFPEAHRARLLIANHRSAFDIAILLAEVDDAVMLSRGDLKDWPVLGRLAQLGDTLFVDRADRADGARAIRSMRKALERKRTLCVFPEGTTHADPFVRPFQAGAFAAAKGLAVEIVPVGIAYASGLEFVEPSMGLHVQKVMRHPDLRACVVVGSPIQLESRKTEGQVREAHAAVQALFERATARVR